MGISFAYFGYDVMLPVVEALRAAGHKLSAVFTFPCDGRFNFNEATIKLAADLSIPVYQQRPTEKDIKACIDAGVTCFMAAGYPWKIPAIDPTRAFGFNIHPSYLPLGRGMMPTPYILLDHPAAAGYTLHTLSDKFDGGAILTQRQLPLASDETVETYTARIAMGAAKDAVAVMADLPAAFKAAAPQDEAKARHFPPPTDALRTIDWRYSVGRIVKISRAYGRYGCLAPVEGHLLAVYALDAWAEVHNHAPGSVVYRQRTNMVIAAADGFVCLKDFEVV